MNFGEFIYALEQMPSLAKVVLRGECLIDCFLCRYSSNRLPSPPMIYCYPKRKVYYNHEEEQVPEFFHSYRGYYEDIALSLSFNDKGYTVKDVLTGAYDSLDFNFEGYKGGSFGMCKRSRLWISEWGISHSLICDSVVLEDTTVYLEISEYESRSEHDY